MELFATYLKEREGSELVHDEKGFATYKKHGQNNIYVVDVYVRPEFRKKRVASGYLNMIADITSCENLITSCDENANNWKESEKAILGYGFELKTRENTMRWYIKEMK